MSLFKDVKSSYTPLQGHVAGHKINNEQIFLLRHEKIQN